MGGSSQTPVTQQTTASKDPWAPAQPYLQEAMQGANQNYSGDVGYQPYSGSTQAPLNANVVGGLQGQYNIAASSLGGTPGVQAGQALGTNMIQNQGLNSGLQSLLQQAQGQQNPYLQDILNTSNRQIGDRVNSSMSGAGRYGSGAHTDVLARSLAEAANPILAQDYDRRQQMQQGILEGGLQRAGQWAQLAPTLDQAQYAPSQALMALGQYQQDYAQKGLNNQIALYNAQQARPWEQLARFNAIVGGAGALGGQQAGTSTVNQVQPSTLQKVLGGGVAGAGLGSMFGPVGSGIGAGAGGLLGLL